MLVAWFMYVQCRITESFRWHWSRCFRSFSFIPSKLCDFRTLCVQGRRLGKYKWTESEQIRGRLLALGSSISSKTQQMQRRFFLTQIAQVLTFWQLKYFTLYWTLLNRDRCLLPTPTWQKKRCTLINHSGSSPARTYDGANAIRLWCSISRSWAA